MMSPYQSLANAIIVLACKDYRDELIWLKYHQPITKEDEEDFDYRTHLEEKENIEEFFSSGFFELLTDLDGDLLLQRIRQEV